MKYKIIYIGILLLIISGCSRLKKATNFITNASAREVYKRDYKISNDLFSIWNEQYKLGLQDNLKISLPYTENGHFLPKSFPVYTYNMKLHAGEIFNFEILTDSVNDLVFIDFYLNSNDSLHSLKKLKSSKIDEHYFDYEIEKTGNYTLIFQPGIETHSNFVVKFYTTPTYIFPVLGAKNRNIQSYWGATRDEGSRSHEGIDIFSERGTPVLAVTNGRLGFTGKKGLGGKQVWLNDTKRRQSIYYAHLDSIAKTSGSVKKGDTLGFVGNTGNARTTPPHLHFGIYRQGAINPLYFVYQSGNFKPKLQHFDSNATNLLVESKLANLRNQPTTYNSTILDQVKNKDTLQLLGKTEDWYHVRSKNKSASFIHESLVSPL
ncbi:peptidoglycan DD-metalloendopeptidase family protein [Zunongwangia sp.]|uniref:peptidoglycan DD-metalloendopeptidase family protein n=1 Tax=Zunongwangia sp. TaxID=1965325 RepID=UPI003AA7E54E